MRREMKTEVVFKMSVWNVETGLSLMVTRAQEFNSPTIVTGVLNWMLIVRLLKLTECLVRLIESGKIGTQFALFITEFEIHEVQLVAELQVVHNGGHIPQMPSKVCLS
jgi:uncharacterized membrane protein